MDSDLGYVAPLFISVVFLISAWTWMYYMLKLVADKGLAKFILIIQGIALAFGIFIDITGGTFIYALFLAGVGPLTLSLSKDINSLGSWLKVFYGSSVWAIVAATLLMAYSSSPCAMDDGFDCQNEHTSTRLYETITSLYHKATN